MEEAWVQDILIQCERAGVPFFFEQWGGINKKKTGRILNGRTYDGMPDDDMPKPQQESGLTHHLEQMMWDGFTGRVTVDFCQGRPVKINETRQVKL